MSAVSKTNVFDKLVPFDHADAASLHELDVFHQNFSQTEELPTARNLNKTYEQGVEEGRELANQEGALRLQEIGALVNILTENLSTLGQDIQASHSRTISNVLRAVLPSLAQQARGAEIGRFIKEISGQSMDGVLHFTVNPKFKSQLEQITKQLSQSGQSMPEFSVDVDEAVTGAAVNAKWRSGGGNIDIDGAVKHCLSLLEVEEKRGE